MVPLRTSRTRMLSFLSMWSLSLCFSSDFLFLPIEVGETLAKYMYSAPFTFHTLHPQHWFFTNSHLTPENQKIKKIHFSCTCHPFLAIRVLSACGKANRPRASYYWPINYTHLPGLHLVCSMIAQGWLNNGSFAISALVHISILYCHSISSIMTSPSR